MQGLLGHILDLMSNTVSVSLFLSLAFPTFGNSCMIRLFTVTTWHSFLSRPLNYQTMMTMFCFWILVNIFIQPMGYVARFMRRNVSYVLHIVLRSGRWEGWWVSFLKFTWICAQTLAKGFHGREGTHLKHESDLPSRQTRFIDMVLVYLWTQSHGDK